MKPTSTPKRVILRNYLLPLLTVAVLFLSQPLLAHDVTGYTASCVTGPKYSIDPTVANVNSGTNYAWQYKNSSNVWVCLVNGNNTINGNTYSISGATSTATTNPAPIVFNNPNSGLQGLVIRCVMSDGSGVNPCNLPSGNTYNSGSNSVNQTINLSNTPCVSSLLALGNRVWYDTDNNGINDGEDGIANVSVKLYKDDNNDNNPDGAAIATDVTDANGYYLFENLAAGNYIVGVVTPAGYMSSTVNGGDPDNNINLDDNGQVTVGNETRGLAITLATGTEPDGINTNTNTNITYDFGFLPDCACTNSTGNLLVNESFENGTTGWSWSGGTLTTGTGYVACGAKNGFNNWSSGTSKVYQDVAIAAGTSVTFKAFAGTHTAGINCSPRLSLIFLNASNTVLDQTDVTVTRDVDVNFNQLAQYTITDVAPAGTTKARVQSSITCDVMKIDAFCLTTNCVTPATPTATKVDPTCSVATGTVTLSNLPSGSWTINGTDNGVPFTFSGSGTTYNQTGVDPGTYIYTVTVAGGCTSGSVTTIINSQPATPATPTATKVDPTCAVATGSITITGPTGTGITYSFNNGAYSTTTTYSNLAAGSVNTIKAKNTAGCISSTTSVTIGTQPATPATPTATKVDPTCAVATGSITITGPTGTGITYSFDGGSYSATTTYSNLVAGSTHTIKAKNTAGCESPVLSLTIGTQPATPAAPTVTKVDPTCAVSTGSVTITAPTGTGITYSFDGSAYSATTTYSNLAAGSTHTVKAKNAAGCESPVTNITIGAQPARASVGDFVWIDANANGLIDGNDLNLPLSGILVSLYNDANGDGNPDGTAIATFTTLANGKYLFSNLCPGKYVIQFGLKNGYGRTMQLNTASKDPTDSDPNVNTGLTPTITLDPGENDLTVDAGYKNTVILPVNFGTITAQANDCQVQISFDILTQQNTKQFVIEYSKDGAVWANIGTIAAAGTTANARTYTFTHTQPIAGNNLYRIKGVDADGKTIISNTVSARSNCAGKGSIVSYPNPVQNVLTVILPTHLQEAQLQFYNGLGQLMIADGRKSGLVRTVNLTSLSPGMYIMKVMKDGQVVMAQKVVKGE